jgi:hypothetical protein
MTEITRRAAIAVGATAAAGALVRPAFAQSPPPVKLATIVPLSGPFAAIGQNI